MSTEEEKSICDKESMICKIYGKISNLDKKLTKLIKNVICFFSELSKDNKFRDNVRLLFFTGLFSFLSACITNNIFLTGLYIFFTMLFGLGAMASEHISKETLLLILLISITYFDGHFF